MIILKKRCNNDNYKMVFAQFRTSLKKGNGQTSLGFWDKNGSSNLKGASNLCPRTSLKKWNGQTSLGFWDKNGSSNLNGSSNVCPTTKPCDSQSKDKQNKIKWTRTCRIVDLAVLAVHRVKLKESEKRDKYLYLAWEL